MIQVSEEYKKACKSPIRQSYNIIKYGLYNKEAKTKINSYSSSSNQIFSNIPQIYDENKEKQYDYISCEKDRVILNDNFIFIKDKTKINPNQNIGYWSKDQSNDNCLFNNNPIIILSFNSNIPFTYLTMYFQEVVEELKISYFIDDIKSYEINIKQNNNETFEANDNLHHNTGYFNKIIIEFIKTKTPNRYIKLNEIDFGIYEIFGKKDIVSIDIIDELSIDSSELSSNSLNVTIKDTNGEYDILNPYNKLKNMQERQEITCYHYLKVGNKYQEIPLGTFLLKNAESSNKELMLECYDDTYFMNKIYYGSKFYIDEEVTNILTDLFTFFNYTKYLIDDELKGIKLTGYIPQVEMREALRLIAEASGCVVNKTRYGITYIFKTYDPCVKMFDTNEYERLNPKKNLYNNVIDVEVYNYQIVQETILYSATLNKGEYIINFKEKPIVYSDYEYDKEFIKNNNDDYTIDILYATCCKITVNSDNQLVEISARYYNENPNIQRVKKGETNIEEYSIKKVTNKLITNKNYLEVANWKLNKNEIKYNFDCLMTPYIEVGDTCKIKTKYKNLNGDYIKRQFIPTYINFTNSLKQNIEGE